MKPYLISSDSTSRPWKPTTLRELGRDETYLENLVAENPEILGLDPYETGISSTVVAFRQTQLSTPTNRTVIPDIVLLSDSGHIVVIEVKLSDNPELKDRRVVAQVIEYAASVANLDDDGALAWLGDSSDESWIEFVHRNFPKANDHRRLAAAFRRRMLNAEIHLVVVSDGAPDGLRDFVAAVSGQAALGEFKLHVVDLKPFELETTKEVLLLPVLLAETEIVSRTSITVTYAEGDQPAVSVVASSAEEVADAIDGVRKRRSVRPEFAAVVDHYDSIAPVELRTIGRSANYRQIRIADWPSAIHYEFYDRSGGAENVGIEVHVESSALANVTAGLKRIADQIGATHEPKWSRGRGRITRRLPVADADGAATAMMELIQQTREDLQQLVDAAASAE